MKTKKPKLNVKLLRKIQKHILADPLRIDMDSFANQLIEAEIAPPCGTTACIAGWACILTGNRANTVGGWAPEKVAAKGAKRLGLEYFPGPSDITGYGEWDQADGDAVKLFQVDNWPPLFRRKYEKFNEQINNCWPAGQYTAEEVAEIRSLKRKLAKITSNRIDYFIKTGE